LILRNKIAHEFCFEISNFLVSFQDFIAPTSVFFCSKFLNPTDQNKGKMRIFCAIQHRKFGEKTKHCPGHEQKLQPCWSAISLWKGREIAEKGQGSCTN
jgi:hypothetical protein